MSVAGTAADFGDMPEGLAERWKAEVRAFEKEREPWVKRVEAIEKRYRDDRDRSDEERRFALLWANVEVLLPTLYARDPKPEVSRRFKDRDSAGRVLGSVIERNLSVAIDQGAGAFGRTMRAAVKDYLLCGQGASWVRYDVVMELAGSSGEGAMDSPDGLTGGLGDPTPGDDGAMPPAGAMMSGLSGVAPEVAAAPEVMPAMPGAAPGLGHNGGPELAATAETVHFDYVHWRDFGFTAGARVWDEVGAVWRISYLTREALIKRFGQDVGERVPLDCQPRASSDDEREPGTFGKASVYEIWDSSDRHTIWLHLGMDEALDYRPYPLRLQGKFPCPCPLFGTLTNGSMVPVPDYVQYQDQAREMDELTGRIASLTSALRLVGFTPGDAAADLQKALDMPGEARLVAVPGWQAFGQAKLSDMILWLPIENVVAVLTQLQALRERVKADAYEITGLSDIIRGSTQASETATAQQIKAQWGSVRVRMRQQDVQRFAAEALATMGDIMVEHFDIPRLLETANVQAMSPADQQQIPAVLAMLQGDKTLLHYRVDIETDSTIEADQAADKQAWSELLQGVSAYMAAMLPVMQGVSQGAPAAAPAMAAMVGELLTGAVRRFKAGPAVESSIEAAFEALGQAAAQPPAPAGPDPAAMAAAQAEQQGQQVKLQAAQMKAQGDGAKIQAEAQRTQADMAMARDDSAHRQADRALKLAQLQHDMRSAAVGPPNGRA